MEGRWRNEVAHVTGPERRESQAKTKQMESNSDSDSHLSETQRVKEIIKHHFQKESSK
jgi:hypothetical protein